MITVGDTGFQEMPRHLADRREDWSRHMPHSSRGEPSKQWSWNTPEIGERQVQGYRRPDVVPRENQGSMFSEPAAYRGPRREHQYQMPLHHEFPRFRETTTDILRWPSPYSMPYVYTNQYLQPDLVKQELISPNLLKCEPVENKNRLQSDNFNFQSHHSLSPNFPLFMPNSRDEENHTMLAKHTPPKPELEILSGSTNTFTPTASTINVSDGPGFREEINQTIRSPLLSKQTSVIRRNEASRADFKNAEGKRSDFLTQPRSERKSMSGDFENSRSEINRTCVPTISANHAGVIKRCYARTRTQENEETFQKKIDFTLKEKDILIQSQALSELTNERTIQPQAAQHNYIERPDPSYIMPHPKYDKS